MVKKSAKPDKTEVNRWLDCISEYEREFEKWEKRARDISRRYADNRGVASTSGGAKRFNILWSNVQTLKTATFAKLPKPDVSRRFIDQDPVGRVAALILERCLDFEIQHYPDYGATMENDVKDRFLGGRGTAWIRYEPHFKALVEDEPAEGDEVTEDVATGGDKAGEEPAEELDYECAPTDYVHWRDFGHVIARTWEEVPAVWRKVYMRRPALVERFGDELGKRIPLDSKPEEDKNNVNVNNQSATFGLIYEIWDKDTKEAVWISKSLGEIVDRKDDPLELEEFFPCPKPLYATLTTDSLVPTPDYCLYQDQAMDLDTLSDRIDGLIHALKVRGVYDAAIPELARLMTEGENNTLIPVKEWTAFAEKNGLEGAIDMLDILPIAQALIYSYKAFDNIKAQIYEITGISDIIRGATDPNETLGAQQLKGQYASMRLRSYQTEVGKFAADLIRLKAQVICNKFDPKTILLFADAGQMNQEDQQKIPQAMELLLGERAMNPEAPPTKTMRRFSIEVSSDSLVFLDEKQEKEDRVEFLGAAAGFLKTAMEVAQAAPQLIPLIAEMLKFGISAFKAGRTIEGAFDAAAQQLVEASKQPKPDPEQAAAQAQIEADKQKHAAELQMREKEQQNQAAIEQHRNELEAQREQQKMQAEMQAAAAKAQFDYQLEQQRMALESERLQFDRWKAELDNTTKIAIAEMSAKSSMETATVKDKARVDQEKAKADTVSGPNIQSLLDTVNKSLESHLSSVDEYVQKALKAPKQIVRGKDGRMSHIVTVQ